jgi:uncharacterized membrane protein SirB2
LKLKWTSPSSVTATAIPSCTAFAPVSSSFVPVARHLDAAKMLLLVAYIGAGTVALKRGRTRRVRVTAFILALFFLGYIFKLALTRQLF